MKTHKNWSYAPFKPLLGRNDDIYVCRVVPTTDSITFDWLDAGCASYNVYIRERNVGEFACVGTTDKFTYTVNSLKSETDYEFYVESGEKKSRIRLARCGESFGTVVNYLHPDDEAYAFSGKYLCSPSIVRHPDGYLLASMDLYEHKYPQNLTLIYRSDDDGKSWNYVSELFPCFWGKMFIYQNELYMLACSTEYGDLLIGKSTDGGKTFQEPTTLLRGLNGKNAESGVHKNPQPVIEYGGRIWNSLEWGSWWRDYKHGVMVMSAEIGSDLLEADNWSFTEPVVYNPEWEGLPKGYSAGNIEGCLIVKDGKMRNIMRYDMTEMTPNYGLVVSYDVDIENPEAPLTYSHCIKFPANHTKFIMRYDDVTKKYYSLASRITDENKPGDRSLLSLMVSDDLENWDVAMDVIDKRNCDTSKVGFQYTDFFIENGVIYYLCRTAMNNANSFHDSNYSIFGKIDLRNV